MCRELWFRASLAWQDILGDESYRSSLVVAHNAVNQALVATAIGLPPTYFRRLLQNNAATTVLDFQPNGDGPPRVNLDRLNQVRLLWRDLHEILQCLPDWFHRRVKCHKSPVLQPFCLQQTVYLRAEAVC